MKYNRSSNPLLKIICWHYVGHTCMPYFYWPVMARCLSCDRLYPMISVEALCDLDDLPLGYI